jgi:predicted dinucleotide-binding enzyme
MTNNKELTQEQMENFMVNIEVNLDTAQAILLLLAKLPYEKVAGTLADIKSQIDTQIVESKVTADLPKEELPEELDVKEVSRKITKE